MSKSNICVIGLSSKFTDVVCQELANKLDMFYANVEKLFEYELTDLSKVEEICGIEYLIKEKVSIVKRICSFENTLICIEQSLLNNEDILKFVKSNCVLIYLRQEKKDFMKNLDILGVDKSIKVIEADAFFDRDNLCRSRADFSVEIDNLEMKYLIEKIVENLVKFYS